MDESDDVNQPESFQEIEDKPPHVQNTETQDIPEFDSAIEFHDFVDNFTLKSSYKKLEQKNPNYKFDEITQEDILNSTNYKYIQNNPVENEPDAFEKGLQAFENYDIITAVLYFDEAVQKGLTDLETWTILTKALIVAHQFGRAIGAIYQILHLTPKDLDYYSHLCTIYIRYKCHYQTCQMAFNWLKNNELYSHLIPPDFTMDNKNNSKLNNYQFSSVEDLYLKAAQLNLSDPDCDLLVMQQKLYYIYNDFDKVVNCIYRIIDSLGFYVPPLFSNLAFYLFLSEKPYQAIDIYRLLIPTVKKDAYLGLGYVHMYLENYRWAIRCFKKLINPQRLVTEFKIQENPTPEAEFDLCLRLYWECSK